MFKSAPRWCLSLLAALLLAAVPSLLAQQGAPNVPDQFTTHPIHGPMTGQTLVNGHVVFVPEVAGGNIGAAPGRPPGGGGGGGGGATDFGQPGGVAAPVLCFPADPTNYDATCASDSYQGETMAVADAAGNLVGSENDIYPGACSASAAPGTVGDCGLTSTVSSNGQSWQRVKLSRTWGGHTFVLGFDPSATVDSQGRYYVAYGVSDGGSNSANGIVVATSANGGASWTKTNAVTLNLSGGKFDDKMWIAADANASSSFKDRLYVAWDRNQSNNQILYVSYSSNGGSSWSAPIKVNDGTSKFERVIYAFPTVAPNGTVYVLWHDYARQVIFIDKSTNGGVSWGTDVAVASTNIGFSIDIGCNGGRSMTPAPQMAIDASGNIFVVFAKNAGPGTNLDVYITYSTNGGANWSAPARASDTSTGHQYNPAIAMDSLGRINVSYLDRRDDTANNCRTNAYLSRFTFSAGTLSKAAADVKATDADSNFNGNANGPGDYSGIACRGSSAVPYFADHRDANIPLQTGTAGAFEAYAAVIP